MNQTAKRHTEAQIKVGIFVSAGISLILLAIVILGGQTYLSKKNTFSAHFNAVDGLISGAKVSMGGVPVGAVESIGFDLAKHNIKVNFSVLQESAEWIRTDSTVEIATQGVLGDKYLSIHPGTPSEAQLPAGSDITEKVSQDLTQFLNQGDQLVVKLNGIASSLDHILKNFESDNRSETFFKGLSSTAKNISQATDKLNRELDQIQIKRAISNLNQIFEKINDGTGTLGALVNDPGLYDQLKALFGGVNRNRIIRNLVRETIKKSDTNTPQTGDSKSRPAQNLDAR